MTVAAVARCPQAWFWIAGMRTRRTEEVSEAAGVGCGVTGVTRASCRRDMGIDYGILCHHSSVRGGGRTLSMTIGTRRSTDETMPCCPHCPAGYRRCKASGGGKCRVVTRLARGASDRNVDGRIKQH